MTQKKTAKQILNSSFMSFGRINDKKDLEDYNIIVTEINEREEFFNTLKILKRYIDIDNLEMNENDRKVVEKAYDKI